MKFTCPTCHEEYDNDRVSPGDEFTCLECGTQFMAIAMREKQVNKDVVEFRLEEPEPVADAPRPDGANRPVTGRNQAVTSANRPVTGRNQAITSANRPVTGRNQAVTSANRPVTGRNQAVTSANRPVTSRNSAVTSANRPVTSRNPAVAAAPRPGTGKPDWRRLATNPKVFLPAAAAVLLLLVAGLWSYAGSRPPQPPTTQSAAQTAQDEATGTSREERNRHTADALAYFAAKEYAKAFRHAQKADPDDQQVQNLLCQMYRDGKGTKKDLVLAMFWAARRASDGDNSLLKPLLQEYFAAEGEAGSADGWRRLLAAAEQGNRHAQYAYGVCAVSNGDAQRQREGVRWLLAATQQGDNDARWSLGNCRLVGRGTDKDTAVGKTLLEAAAADDHDYQLELGARLLVNADPHLAGELGVDGAAMAAVTALAAAYPSAADDAQVRAARFLPDARKWLKKADEQQQTDGSRYLLAKLAECERKTAAALAEWRAAEERRRAAEERRRAAEEAAAAKERTKKENTRTAIELFAAKEYAAARTAALAADQDDPEIAFILGHTALRGLGCVKSPLEAKRQLEHAAGHKHPAAANELGEMYWLGQGVRKDVKAAKKWWGVAAAAGVANAQWRLGEATLREKGDTATATALLIQAAEQGHLKAQLALGRLYRQGAAGLAPDPGQALRWYREAARHGDPEGMFQAGTLSLGSPDGSPENREAAEWLRKAAEKGHDGARAALGLAYFKGEGVAQDFQQAAELLLPLTREGHCPTEAQYACGYLLLRGQGTDANPREGLSLLEKAAKQDHPDANFALAAHYAATPDPRDRQQAVRYCRRAAELGHPEAKEKLPGYEREVAAALPAIKAAEAERQKREAEWLRDGKKRQTELDAIAAKEKAEKEAQEKAAAEESRRQAEAEEQARRNLAARLKQLREAEGRLAETTKEIAEEEAKRKAEEAARAAADNPARSTKAATKPIRPPDSSDDFRRQLEKSAQEIKGYGVGY